jgi:hypothetical protein
MKKLILLAVALISLSAQAGLPPRVYQEGEVTIALNMFAHNPEISQMLNKDNLSVTQLFSTQDLGQGKYKYIFRVARMCECLPKSGMLEVEVNYAPTHADGAPEYKYELKIDKK